ncbi:MAG: hypothetical protein HQ472_02795 [Ignavibacteria bacterium]|nr:hypothetical protein [Ignavibacteria bacterium]
MIVSVIGEPVLETMVTDEEISLDVSGLAIGAYIVSAGQGRKVGRLLILR